jgi:hypothetical protein
MNDVISPVARLQLALCGILLVGCAAAQSEGSLGASAGLKNLLQSEPANAERLAVIFLLTDLNRKGT